MGEMLSGFVLAMLVADGFSPAEVDALGRRFRAEGARLHLVSPGGGDVVSDGRRLACDADAREIHALYYDALVIPGGAQTVALAADDEICELVRSFRFALRPIGALGEGIDLLRAAGVVEGQRVCAPEALREGLTGAGFQCVEGDVETDALVVTAPDEARLPAFADALAAEVQLVRRRDMVEESSMESFPASDAHGGAAI